MHPRNNIPADVQPEVEALQGIQKQIDALTNKHITKRKRWHPSTILAESMYFLGDKKKDQLELIRLLRNQAKQMPDLIRVCLLVNKVTEDGIVQFPRALANSFGENAALLRWLDVWSAEEDFHGGVLDLYIFLSEALKPSAVEELGYLYKSGGFHPPWEGRPFWTIFYTILQEKATQVSHQGIGKLVSNHEPVLAAILNYIKADEGAHHHVYREFFKLLLSIDPNRALMAALQAIRKMHMPGKSMPGYDTYIDAFEELKIYTIGSLATIVEEVSKYLNIGNLCNLSGEGGQAQEQIMDKPKALRRTWQLYKHSRTRKSFSPEFLYGREVIIEPH